MQTYANQGKGGSCQCQRFPIIFLIENLVTKLLTIMTRYIGHNRALNHLAKLAKVKAGSPNLLYNLINENLKI